MLACAVAIGAVAGLLGPRAGRYGAPRAAAVVLVAAGMQLASLHVPAPAHGPVLAGSIALGVSWLVLQRDHLASRLLRVGVALNVAVIALNRGMPVDPDALAAVGRAGTDVTDGFLYKHVPMTGDTMLPWLGDRIPVPVQRNVISPGDVLMAIAICLWVADGFASWRYSRRSAGAVHGEHRGGPCRELVRGDELANLGEDGVGRLAPREPAVDLDGQVGSGR